MVNTSNLNSSINAILENNMFLKDADLTQDLNSNLELFAHDLNVELDTLNSMVHDNINKISTRSKDFADFLRDIRSICDNYNLIHFLLKYRYTENWNREVHENYLPLSVEDIAGKIDAHYELIYFDHYILPFLANIVQVDFDITIKDYTHIKFIYQQKGNK